MARGQAVPDAEHTAAVSCTSSVARSPREAAAAEEAGIGVEYSSGSNEGSPVQQASAGELAGIGVEYSSGSDEGSSVQEASAGDLSDSASDTDVDKEQPARVPMVSEADWGASLSAVLRRQQVGPSPVCGSACASTALCKARASRHSQALEVHCCGRQCKLCHKQLYLAAITLLHVCQGPGACTPCSTQPGQQRAAHDAAHHPPDLCLLSCVACVQSADSGQSTRRTWHACSQVVPAGLHCPRAGEQPGHPGPSRRYAAPDAGGGGAAQGATRQG